MPAINLPDGTLYYAQSHPDATAFPPLVLVHASLRLTCPATANRPRPAATHSTPTRATSRRCWTRWLSTGR
jgi:hypothetical protein